MTTGLTAQGYVATSTAEEVADINTQVWGNISADLDLDPDQPIGQLIAIFAAKFAQLTELGATVYNALNPAAAEGNLLVNACSLSGTLPQVATYSYCTATLTLNASTTVHAGAVASVSNQPTNTWVLTGDVTSTSGGGYPGVFRSSVPGIFSAPAMTLAVIQTPTIGWTGVSNTLDSTPGQNADTDTTLRAKRQLELAGQGSGDTDAIRAKLLELDYLGASMVQAFVFENTTLVTDATGLPGKSFRAVVWDGTGSAIPNSLIAQTIWDNKPSGVQAYGAINVAVTDSAGNPQNVGFDRATQLETYVTCTVTAAPNTLIDATARTAIRTAIQNYTKGNALLGIPAAFNLGVSIIDLPFRASALVPGLTIDVPTFAFDFHSTPTNTGNLAVTGLQIATVATTDISVNGSFS